VCDLDGVLLNTPAGFSKLWSEILGVSVPEDSFIHWDHALSLGVDKELCSRFWDEFWQDTELEPYPGAGVFVNRVKYLGYRFVILTSRASTDAQASLFRDIKKIQYGGKYEIDDVLVCDHRNENKSSYINKIEGVEFFLDDHVKNTVDVAIRCPNLKEVMLFDRPWNGSLDLAGYTRICSYGDVLARLSRHIS
jgi:hypothetical protein